MKFRNLLVYVFCLTAGVLSATAASAERRVALVIGNSNYKSAPQLQNTISDSTAIGNLFKSVGFEVVISRTDLGVVDFKRAVRDFLLTAETADIAVVYYAGHGVEIGGTNYLVPIDAKLGRDYDVEDEAIALDRIIWALEPVRRLRLILLDACRNNPFPMKIRSAGVRSAMQGGLGKIDDVSADTLVAYAAKAGNVSYDGDGNNSPYATALLKHLGEPGVDIRIALGRVRDDVLGMTGGRQEPFIYGSLGGSTMALVPASAQPSPAKMIEPPPPPPPQQVAKPSVAPVPSPPVVVATQPKPVAVQPAPAQPNPAANTPVVVAKAAVPKASELQAAREAIDPATACARDEQRLAQLRSEPSRDQIVNFQKELSCGRLRSQVQRLLESMMPDSLQQAAPITTAHEPPKPQMQAQARPMSADEVCSRDAAQLMQLRADPSAEAIAKFDRGLGCERIRPQLQRLRESMGQ
jgi:Caspase domain